MARTAMRSGPLLAALLVSRAILIAGAALGYVSVSADWAAESMGGMDMPEATFDSSWLSIVGQNMSVLMLLYSGALTLGLTTMLGLAMLSLFLGTTAAVGVNNVGVVATLFETGMYAPIEFLGIIVAAAAGLYPGFALLGRTFTGDPPEPYPRIYLAALAGSLKMLAVGAALVLVAATIEASVIAVR